MIDDSKQKPWYVKHIHSNSHKHPPRITAENESNEIVRPPHETLLTFHSIPKPYLTHPVRLKWQDL